MYQIKSLGHLPGLFQVKYFELQIGWSVVRLDRRRVDADHMRARIVVCAVHPNASPVSTSRIAVGLSSGVRMSLSLSISRREW